MSTRAPLARLLKPFGLLLALGALSLPAAATAEPPAEAERWRDVNDHSLEARKGRYELYKDHAAKSYNTSLERLNRLGVRFHLQSDGKVGVHVKGDAERIQQKLKWQDLKLERSGLRLELKNVGRFEGERTGRAQAKERYDFYRKWAERKGTSLKELNEAGVWLVLDKNNDVEPILRGNKAETTAKLAERGLELRDGKLVALERSERRRADESVTSGLERTEGAQTNSEFGMARGDLTELLGTRAGHLTVDKVGSDQIDVLIEEGARMEHVAAQMEMFADQTGRKVKGRLGNLALEAQPRAIERYATELAEPDRAEIETPGGAANKDRLGKDSEARSEGAKPELHPEVAKLVAEYPGLAELFEQPAGGKDAEQGAKLAEDKEPFSGTDRALPRDLPALEEIERSSFGDRARDNKALEDRVLEGRTFVFVDNDVAATSVTVKPMMDEKNENAVLYLDRLATHPYVRRKGYATKLMQDIEQIAGLEGLTDVRLHVAADNEPARAFLTKLGYETLRSDGEKGELMRKVLSPDLSPEEASEVQAEAAAAIREWTAAADEAATPADEAKAETL